jgi:hypothetical protein
MEVTKARRAPDFEQPQEGKVRLCGLLLRSVSSNANMPQAKSTTLGMFTGRNW